MDADGASTAYGPSWMPGTLDYLANAGQPGDWAGVATDRRGNPVVQDGRSPAQPSRGHYVSQTSLRDDWYGKADVRRYVDATRIPYVALPPAQFRRTGLRLGDWALVISAITGCYTYAIFADSKKVGTVGEFSIAAAAALGAPTDARRGSLPCGIITVLFPGSGLGNGSFIRSPREYATLGRHWLEYFSHRRDRDDRLPTAFPEYPPFSPALYAAGY